MLIELLVVILILGALAAIAPSSFLSQGATGYDASAKSNISYLVKLIESCKLEETTDTDCDEESEKDGGVLMGQDRPLDSGG